MTEWCTCNKLKEAEEKAAKWDAIVRCVECKYYEPEYTWEEFREVGYPYEICMEPPTCTLGYALSGVARVTIPNGFCAWGERQDA